jgi:hypothetical protein
VTSDDATAHDVERLLTEPVDRLHAFLERAERQLDSKRAELAEVRYALYELSADGARAGRHRAGGAIEALAHDVAPSLLRYLLDQTTDIVRVSTLRIDIGAGIEQENVRANKDMLLQGRFRQQTIYPMGIMDTGEGRAWARSFAASGEEQRVSLAPPSEFAVFDQRALVATAEWGDPASGYVLVRDPMVVAGFTALFDRAFARALPVAPDDAEGHDHDDEDDRLVRLLGLGLKDESIARYLGCSLRTVRRRVAQLMERHAVQTRFQLGVSVATDDLSSPVLRMDR